MQSSALHVYIIHETEDIELIHAFLDALDSIGISEVFVSPFNLPGTIAKLDERRKIQIRNCDFLVAVITRRSLRWSLVEEEIEFARSNGKIIIPMVDETQRIRGVGEVFAPFVVSSFRRTRIVRAARLLLERIISAQISLHISSDFIAKARRGLERYSQSHPIQRMTKIRRMATFRQIVAETLRDLGYSVSGQDSISLTRAGFDLLEAWRGRRQVCVGCIFRTVGCSDVAGIAKLAQNRNAESAWIVSCSGFSEEVQKMAYTKGIRLVHIKSLLEELSPATKEPLYQRFLEVLHATKPIELDKAVYSELRDMLRIVRRAKTPQEKGSSLEKLSEYFVGLFPGLEVVGRNIRIEAEELDLIVRNEGEKIFWQRLGSPLIVECKNWTKPVGAREIRDLVQKMREVRTAIMIAAHGVTSKNGADYEILEARKNMKFILVFTLWDIAEVLKGVNPEQIVNERFYSLWTGRISNL